MYERIFGFLGIKFVILKESNNRKKTWNDEAFLSKL